MFFHGTLEVCSASAPRSVHMSPSIPNHRPPATGCILPRWNWARLHQMLPRCHRELLLVRRCHQGLAEREDLQESHRTSGFPRIPRQNRHPQDRIHKTHAISCWLPNWNERIEVPEDSCQKRWLKLHSWLGPRCPEPHFHNTCPGDAIPQHPVWHQAKPVNRQTNTSLVQIAQSRFHMAMSEHLWQWSFFPMAKAGRCWSTSPWQTTLQLLQLLSELLPQRRVTDTHLAQLWRLATPARACNNLLLPQQTNLPVAPAFAEEIHGLGRPSLDCPPRCFDCFVPNFVRMWAAGHRC